MDVDEGLKEESPERKTPEPVKFGIDENEENAMDSYLEAIPKVIHAESSEDGTKDTTSCSLDTSEVERDPIVSSMDIGETKVERDPIVSSVDIKESKVERDPIVSFVDIEESKVECDPIVSSMDIEESKVERDPIASSVDIVESKVERDPIVSSMDIEEPKVDHDPIVSSVYIEESKVECDPIVSSVDIEGSLVEKQTIETTDVEKITETAESLTTTVMEEGDKNIETKNKEDVEDDDDDVCLIPPPEIETVKVFDSDSESNDQDNEDKKKDDIPKEGASVDTANNVDDNSCENKDSKTTDNNVVNVESSSEDDAQENKESNISQDNVNKEEKDNEDEDKPAEIPKEVDTICLSTENKSDNIATDNIVKPATELPANVSQKSLGLEIFNLDSDDDTDNVAIAATQDTNSVPKKLSALELQNAREGNKCVNDMCVSTGKDIAYTPAPLFVLSFYDVKVKRRVPNYVCHNCLYDVSTRMKELMVGVKDMKSLMSLEMEKESEELVEISDSDTDTDNEDSAPSADGKITEKELKFLEEMDLSNIINETWQKYKLDDRLKDAKEDLDLQIKQLEKESAEIDALFDDCQNLTDSLRTELYATFAGETKELAPIHIIDPGFIPSLKIPHWVVQSNNEKRGDGDDDISVVQLSAESAPPDLPMPGELIRQPLLPGENCYVTPNQSKWLKGTVVEHMKKVHYMNFTSYKVRIETRNNKVRGTSIRVCSGKDLAYSTPANVRLAIGTRIISTFIDTANANAKEQFYSGIIAEIPSPVNNYRYLIFFDDGYASYAFHSNIRVVVEASSRAWLDVKSESSEFVKKYLMSYPERPMVRLHAGQCLKTEWNGKWWDSRVLKVDCSLVHIHFESDNRNEWIYRGSTRLLPLFLELQAAERHRPRGLPRANKPQIPRQNMPYVEYTRSDLQNNKAIQEAHIEMTRKQRAVAKKSTTAFPQPPIPFAQPQTDALTSRVVYYTPKVAVRPLKMVSHTCSSKCNRTDVLPLKDLRTYNPLAKPLLSGWERLILRYKGRKVVMYRTPCGRRIRNMPEMLRYLQCIGSQMSVDLFDFNVNIHCLAEFVLTKCNVSKKDLSHGRENVPVPCVNYYDNALPEFCSYNTERTPTAGVPLNLDPEFLCGCDCTDDCEDKSKCACWQMTLEGARTIGLEGNDLGYVYKRLPEPLPSGIFECNSRCKCKQTCLNRVAQHPLQLKLQVFKTSNRGWGIRALNDVPKGCFLCVYAGNLLTDATANLDGVNEGDEYLAELDYIEVVEQMKEGYENDISEADKELDKKESEQSGDTEEESTQSEEEDDIRKSREDDDDFKPAYDVSSAATFRKTLRKRNKKTTDQVKAENGDKKKDGDESSKEKNGDNCITISDDEEVREPSSFTAQAGMGNKEYVSKYRSVRSLFGKDEACYIMDAKVQGNIGRYLNHSCSPNVFVQNVFVDTHDPRFPWVAFFALSHVKAGTELTWNYNYDVGSVPGKIMYCYCSAPNCRGRLL